MAAGQQRSTWTALTAAGVCISAFSGQALHSECLDLEEGRRVLIVEETKDWFRGCLFLNGSDQTFSLQPRKLGIFPKQNIMLITEGIDDNDDRSPPPVHDISAQVLWVLKDWKAELVRLLANQQYAKFSALMLKFQKVLDYRQALLPGALSAKECRIIKSDLMAEIEAGNQLLGESIHILRDPLSGSLLCKDRSFLDMYRCQESMSSSGTLQKFDTIESKPGNRSSEGNMHLFLTLRGVSCAESGELHCTFGILSGKTQTFITECFRAKALMATSSDDATFSAECAVTLFTDLDSNATQTGDLYLVCRVAQKDKNGILRPFGNGISPLSGILSGRHTSPTHLGDCRLPIFVPQDESNWANYADLVQQDLMNSATHLSTSTAIHVALDVFHGRLSVLKNDYPRAFSDLRISNRLGLAHTSEGSLGNHMHVSLQRGDLSSLQKTTGLHDLQVEMQIRLPDGEFLSCLYDGTGKDATIKSISSIVYSNNPLPVWNLSIRLDLEPERLLKSHLYLTFRTLSKGKAEDSKPFAFAFLPLFQKLTSPTKNGDHTLNLYKFDERLESPTVYLTLPAGPSIFVPAAFNALTAAQLKDAAEVMAKMKPALKDTVQVSTLLDSRVLTSSTPLLNLLEWKTLMTQQRGDILKIVDDSCLVEAEEVIKFYPKIIKTLFEILDVTISEAAQESLNIAVYKCLIQVLSLTQDKRFSEHAGEMDASLQDIPVTYRVSSRLYGTLEKFMQQPMDPIEARTLRSAIKVWHFIHRFILRPFLVENELVSGQGLVTGFMKQVHWVMQNHNSDIALASQMLILQHFNSLLTEWTPLYLTSAEVLDVADSFMSGIKASHSKIVTFRYAFMKQFISSDVAKVPANQTTSTRLVVQWLNGVLAGKWGKLPTIDESSNRRLPRLKGLAFATSQKRHDLKSCLDFIMFFMDALNAFNADALMQVLDLLPALLNSFVNFMDWCKMRHSQPKKSAPSSPTKSAFDDPAQMLEVLPASSALVDAPLLLLSDLTAALVAILDVNTSHYIEDHFSRFASEKGYDSSLVYLSEWLDVVRHLTTEVFPTQSVSVAISMKHNTLRLLRAIGCSISIGITSRNEAQKNEQLQDDFLHTLLAIVQLHHAQCVRSRSQEQLVMISMHTDILKQASTLLFEMWSNFDTDKSRSQFTGAFLEMALSEDVHMRDVGIRILFSLILVDFKSHGTISRLEDEIFEQMPWVIEKSRDIHDNQIARQFEGLFKDASLSQGDKKSFSDQGRKFIHFLETFLALIVDIKVAPDGLQNQEARASSMLKMIQFLSETNHLSMRPSFFQSLYELHLSSGNFVEAAMLLKYYADSLPGASGKHQEQDGVTGSFDSSREDIYWQCIEMFDKGNAWERAVDVCKVLASSYSSELFDYEQLSTVLKRQAELLHKIAKNERFFPSYFRVGFYGNGFPSNLDGKAFVYKGLEWEKLGSFCERLLKNFPNSKIVKDVPSAETDEGSRLLQVTWLDPIMDSEVVPGRNRASSLPWQAIDGAMSSCVASGPKSSHDLLDPKAISDLELEIPDFVLRYFKASETNTFISSKNIRRKVPATQSDLSSAQVDCLSLSSQFTVSYTRERFPHLANHSEIIGTHSFEMEPIQYATMAIAKKTKELSSLSSKFSNTRAKHKSDAWSRDSFDSESKRRSDNQPNTSPFTMALNGAVDAPVNGGIPLYKSVFLSSKFVTLLKEEGKDDLLNSFKLAIDEQVTVMNDCLQVHWEVISPEMRPLHNELISLFNKNFHEEISRLNLIVARNSSRSSFEASAPRPSSASTTSQMSLSLNESEISQMSEVRKNSIASKLSIRSSFNLNDEISRRFSGSKSVSSIDVSTRDKEPSKTNTIERVEEETGAVNISPTKVKSMQQFASRRKIFRMFEKRPSNE